MLESIVADIKDGSEQFNDKKEKLTLWRQLDGSVRNMKAHLNHGND
jgi:hypothetical protein